MLVEIKVPVLAESVADATLLDWHKSQGDVIRRGDNLIDLETDKVTLEVVAQNDGVLAEVRKQTGDTVVADEVLAVIDTDAELPAASNDAGAAPASAPDDSAAAESKPARAGPAARKAAQEAGVELSAVNGTGRDGRITKKDVLKVIEGGASEAPAVVPTVVESSERVEERVPMTRLRRRASERLLSAQRENAILTTFNEVNMQPVIDLRNRYRDEFEKQHDVKMGFMGFFVKAAIEALKRYPVVNASVDGDETIYHGYFDIGIAVGSERGLVVPILRDANYLSFSDIERRIRDFGERARDGKLTID
ncbi:MAG: dihydrolipoamide succinyltransferase, partial [Gammaproteobacteria bacterium]|nr:2-oxo acid dehydrogenase subunit E2 [Gammaproteobacteria bacterium]NNM01844.1 dihydrolipoamide succinyltransferase [Gammaproteobacteria bacterium]